jgi:putative membrane protein
MKAHFAVLCLAAMPCLFAQATGEAHKNVSKTVDQEFVSKAAAGGLFEVDAAKLAADRATNSEVKSFAQTLQRDHQQANDKLSSIAQSKGLTVPSRLDDNHRKELDKLKEMSGEAFDRAYVQLMTKDHPKDISLFERQSRSGNDADLKAFASDTLPKLKEHLRMAQELDSGLKSAGRK